MMPHANQPEPICPDGHFSTIVFNGRPFCLECGSFLDIEGDVPPGQSHGERTGQPHHNQAAGTTGGKRKEPGASGPLKRLLCSRVVIGTCPLD